jgi:TRAP-type mannitol/chloroaromatic compound transport system permease small subunit/TM2 domain-containing membrane protein YozV
MPNLNFIMPHWLYWGGLIVFPLVAMYLVRQQRRHGPAREPAYFTAYLFWLCSGFAGVHRFYLKSAWAFVFIPVFLGIIYCSAEVRDVHEGVSQTYAALDQARTNLDQARNDLDDAKSANRPTETLERAVEEAQAEAQKDDAAYQVALAVHERWYGFARDLGILLALMLVVDAFLIPRRVRRLRAANGVAESVSAVPEVHEAGTGEDPTLRVHTRFTDVIERVNAYIGEYVSYWAVISVFVYYYEVLARYVFSSPTNWVHESMFLMYGMQYMLAGAYAYSVDQHVRVDVLYTKLSTRGKAIADIVSSVFFFIFTLTMLWTGARFALDSIGMNEHSFTEWGIQYWPVKLMIPVGAALIVMQGIAKLTKDVVLVLRKEV